MPYTLTIKQKKAKSGQIYYPLELNLVEKPTPGPSHLLVKLEAAALNRRDLFIRQHLYPKISFKSPLFSDGCGTVVEAGEGCNRTDLLNKLVILTPFRGWASNPEGPEDWSNFETIGGVDPWNDLGCGQNYIVVHESEVEPCPDHLSAIEGSAVPCCGITGWRALMTKSGNAVPGRNILVTGIGGGVALQVLQFGVALGCNMYVSSSSEEKIQKALEMGAKGGVNYSRGNWEKTLIEMLPSGISFLDAIIDGAGGNIMIKATDLLKPGGVVVVYGMTVAPTLDWPMQAVLKNIELRGSTLGSRVEFTDMVNFIRDHKITPVISRSVKGLDCVKAIDGLFEDIKEGKQFGKLVVEI